MRRVGVGGDWKGGVGTLWGPADCSPGRLRNQQLGNHQNEGRGIRNVDRRMGETRKLAASGFPGQLGHGLRVCGGCKALGDKEDLAPIPEKGINPRLII